MTCGGGFSSMSAKVRYWSEGWVEGASLGDALRALYPHTGVSDVRRGLLPRHRRLEDAIRYVRASASCFHGPEMLLCPVRSEDFVLSERARYSRGRYLWAHCGSSDLLLNLDGPVDPVSRFLYASPPLKSSFVGYGAKAYVRRGVGDGCYEVRCFYDWDYMELWDVP